MRINWSLVLFRHAVAILLVLAWIGTMFTKQPDIIAVVMTFVMLGAIVVIASQTVLMIEATTNGRTDKAPH